MSSKTVCVDAVQVNGFKAETKAGNHVLYIDQPTVSGGTDTGPTPLEYLFISLAGCIVSVGNIVAKQQRLPVRKIEVHIEGEIDPDVFNGKSTDNRAGFYAIRVHTKIDGDMSQAEKEKFIHDIDARCPISDNISNLSSIEFIVE